MLKKSAAIILGVGSILSAVAIAVPLGILLTERPFQSSDATSSSTANENALSVQYGTTDDELLQMLQERDVQNRTATLVSSAYGPTTAAGETNLALVVSYASADQSAGPEVISYQIAVVPRQLPVFQRTDNISVPFMSEKTPDLRIPDDMPEGYDFQADFVLWTTEAGTVLNSFDLSIMKVGDTIVAMYPVVPLKPNYAGPVGSYKIVYTIVKSLAADGANIAWTETLPYGVTELPVLSPDVLPALPEGHRAWAEPEYKLAGEDTGLTAAELATLPNGGKFTMVYRSELDENHEGAPVVVTVSYTIRPATAGKFADGGFYDSSSLVWGKITALPRPVEGANALPSVPDGYIPWGAPRYNKTLAELQAEDAGATVTLLWQTGPDTNHVGDPIAWTAVYTVALAPAPLIPSTSVRLSLDLGTRAFPVYTGLPDLAADGYQEWSTPVFTSGTKDVTTVAELAALKENEILTATYTAQVDNNHTGTMAVYTLNYLVRAPAAAAGKASSYADTTTVTYGAKSFPLPAVGSTALPSPGVGWNWSDPTFSITLDALSRAVPGTKFTATYRTVLLPYYKGTAFTRVITYTVLVHPVSAGPFADVQAENIYAVAVPSTDLLPKLPEGYGPWTFAGWRLANGTVPDTTKKPAYGTVLYATWRARVQQYYVGTEVTVRSKHSFTPL